MVSCVIQDFWIGKPWYLGRRTGLVVCREWAASSNKLNCSQIAEKLCLELEKLEDRFGENLSDYRRFTKKGWFEETEVVELTCFRRKWFLELHSVRKDWDRRPCISGLSTDFHTLLQIWRVCKKIRRKNHSGVSVNIRYRKCVGNHTTNDHPQSDETLKCLARDDTHSFNICPQRKHTSKKALKGGQKSKKEVLMSRKRQSEKSEIASPEYLDRLSYQHQNMKKSYKDSLHPCWKICFKPS